jgi:hypothetical protein
MKIKAYSVLLLLIALWPLAPYAVAQGMEPGEFAKDEITITLDEAIQIALINNYMIRKGLLDVEHAEAQIREAWGSVYPQLNSSGSYTRNLRTPNPFAGSDAGGIFETLGAMEWLAYNENARTDGDPETSPIPFDEFLDGSSRAIRMPVSLHLEWTEPTRLLWKTSLILECPFLRLFITERLLQQSGVPGRYAS